MQVEREGDTFSFQSLATASACFSSLPSSQQKLKPKPAKSTSLNVWEKERVEILSEGWTIV
jgi:hypothetical protein